jgi:hypothetical protein
VIEGIDPICAHNDWIDRDLTFLTNPARTYAICASEGAVASFFGRIAKRSLR